MITAWLRFLAIPVSTALWLTGCGGGVGSGGTGDVAGGQGVGTITGFGSVIVDGVHYDDRGAQIEYETDPGAPDAPGDRLGRDSLAVGQRVELSFDTDGDASRASVFRIVPELVGPVTSLDPLRVAGQRVDVNADAARGPLTQFGDGLASAAGLALGDRLEVHGMLVREIDGTVVLQATRLQRLEAQAQSQAWTRLSGTVSGLSADGLSFRLAGLTIQLARRNGNGTVITPASSVLADGQRVQVWTRQAPVGDTVQAERVRIVSQRKLSQGQALRLSGVASTCPDRPRTAYVCLGTTAVALDGAFFEGGLNAASLRDGLYVVLSDGRYDLSTGAVRSAHLRLLQ